MGFGVKQEDITAIKAKTDNLPGDPSSQTAVVSQIQTSHTTTDGLVAVVDGLVAVVDTTVDAVKVKTDNLPTDPADESLLEEEIQRGVTRLDFWSDTDDVIDLPAVAADVNLPDVVISGIPSGIALVRVVALLKVRVLENTNAGGSNAIVGAQAIRVKKSTGTWGVDDIPAINLPDNLWTVAASTRESGDVLIGDNDLKAEVDGNGTYNLRFENALVDRASLRLNDVLIGLRFYFTTS